MSSVHDSQLLRHRRYLECSEPTDGLDGLAIMPAVMVAAALAIFAYVAGNVVSQNTCSCRMCRALASCASFSARLPVRGLGFLWFNAYPAEVFMGDVGALALGGALGTVAVIVRQEIVLSIMGGVFVAETLSSWAQVLYSSSPAANASSAWRRCILTTNSVAGRKLSGPLLGSSIMLVLFGLSTLKLR